MRLHSHATLVGDDWAGRVGASNIARTRVFRHCNWLLDDGVVNFRCMGVVLVDKLGCVVMLSLMSLSFDDWLYLFNDMLVYVLVDFRGVNRGGVGLFADGTLVGMLALLRVLCRHFLGDVLSAFTLNDRCFVLVVSVVVLLVEDGLNLLVDVYLIAGAVYDWGHFVVSMLGGSLVSYCILDIASVGSSNSVIDNSL